MVYSLLFSFALRKKTVPVLMRNCSVAFWLGVATFFTATAQTDTALTLPMASVVGKQLQWLGLPQRVQWQADSLQGLEHLQTFSEYLASNQGLFLRTYSPGGLATLTWRGLSAAHTAVWWNGMPIVNPMNGVPDFALLPLGLMEQAQLIAGGAAALYGSGALAGQLTMHTTPIDSAGWHGRLAIGHGSFGAWRHVARLSHRKGPMAWAVGWARHYADNDYPIGHNRRQQWARLRVANWMADVQWQQGRSTWHAFLWWQQADRQIPPSLTAALTHDVQQDQSLKMGFRYQQRSSRGLWKALVAVQRDAILFYNDLVDSAQSQSTRAFVNAEKQWMTTTQWQWRVGTTWDYTVGEADAYLTRPQRQTFELLASAKKSWPGQRQALWFNARLTWVPLSGKPVPSGTANWRIGLWPRWAAHLALNRNFRLPTFNDLFWQEASAKGNPDLKPERAIGAEGTLEGPMGKLTIYQMKVNDWILWQPVNAIWQPLNVQVVWTRGFDFEWQHAVQWQDQVLKGLVQLHFVRATVVQRYDRTTDLIGKQLIYTPQWTARFQLTWQRNAWHVRLWQQFVSKRFTTSDNNPGLAAPPVWLTHLAWLWHKKSWSLELQIQDLFDRRPQWLRYRPLPGRSLWLTATYLF